MKPSTKLDEIDRKVVIF